MPLALTGIAVAFGDLVVLDGLDLTLSSGESVAVMGPSGSGKTTLLSVIAGLRAPDGGTRTVTAGDSITSRADDLSIAWVFQTSPVLMRRTALENATLGARCAGASRRDAQRTATAALDQLDIAELADHRLYRLSGGERQRVVIARAMSSGAEIVIADEPTAALDGDAKTRVCDALGALASAGAAVVVATHDPGVAASCTRTLHLRSGHLAEEPG